MGTVPAALVTELREQAHLRRAVETGTFRGDGTAMLAELFREMVANIRRAPLAAKPSATLAA